MAKIKHYLPKEAYLSSGNVAAAFIPKAFLEMISDGIKVIECDEMEYFAFVFSHYDKIKGEEDVASGKFRLWGVEITKIK